MKNLRSLILVLGLAPMFAHAEPPKEEPKPRTTYQFDMTPLKGEVKEFKVSFSDPETADMSAQTEAKLNNGEVLTGEFSCTYKNDHSMIQCQRDDDGGEFSFIGSGEEYKLKFERFDLTDEGDEREVVVQSRNPAEEDSLPGVKK